jgi:hypothetical protein
VSRASVTACANLSGDAVACPALSQREQDGAAGLADHGVGLPVAGAGAFLDDLRPLVNRNPAPPDLVPALIASVALPTPFLVTQAGMEITATALVRIDILVDPFVTDMQSLLHRQPALTCSGLHSSRSRLSTHSQVPRTILGLALASRRARARCCACFGR